MPAVPSAAPKAKKATSKKATTTTSASKAAKSKSKAKPKANFPNLPGAAGGTSTAVDQSSAEDSTPAPPTKKIKATAAAKKAATKGKGKAPAAKDSKKRKTDGDDQDASEAEKTATEEPRTKRAKTAEHEDEKASKKTKAKPAPKKVVICHAPTDRLNVYVFGEGSSGELGLGTAKNAIDVKRPRLNALLPADTVGVVHIACGGMHVAALTHDGKVLTWGVNDQGALGRDTKWEGGLRDVGESDNESDAGSDSGLNPYESTPAAITTFPEGTVIVKLSAGDSHTLALTDEGLVYGWGTFRVSHFQQEVHWIALLTIHSEQRRHPRLQQRYSCATHTSSAPQPQEDCRHHVWFESRSRPRPERRRLYLGRWSAESAWLPYDGA